MSPSGTTLHWGPKRSSQSWAATLRSGHNFPGEWVVNMQQTWLSGGRGPTKTSKNTWILMLMDLQWDMDGYCFCFFWYTSKKNWFIFRHHLNIGLLRDSGHSRRIFAATSCTGSLQTISLLVPHSYDIYIYIYITYILHTHIYIYIWYTLHTYYVHTYSSPCFPFCHAQLKHLHPGVLAAYEVSREGNPKLTR